MIKVFDGDLLESGADIIGHQTNCKGAFNSGVAKQVRDKYPKVFAEYKELCEKYEDSSKLLGVLQEVIVDKHTTIANLFAQDGYGYDGKRYTDLEALKSCLRELRNMKEFKEELLGKKVRVAIPWKIGSVRGGCSWDDVLEVILEVFENSEIELWRMDKG